MTDRSQKCGFDVNRQRCLHVKMSSWMGRLCFLSSPFACDGITAKYRVNITARSMHIFFIHRNFTFRVWLLTLEKWQVSLRSSWNFDQASSNQNHRYGRRGNLLHWFKRNIKKGKVWPQVCSSQIYSGSLHPTGPPPKEGKARKSYGVSGNGQTA